MAFVGAQLDHAREVDRHHGGDVGNAETRAADMRVAGQPGFQGGEELL